MSTQITQTDDGVLTLQGSLDVYSADAVREALLNQLSEKGRFELDLRGIEQCDVIGIQLLLAARSSAVRSSRSFRILNTPPAVTAAAAGAGLPSAALSDSIPA